MQKTPDANAHAQQGGRFEAKDAVVVPLPAAAAARAPFSEPMDYSIEDLRRDRERPLVSMASLPLQYGWPENLDRLLGGGLGPGDLVGIGAAGAGAGKTAFLSQTVDGLALRSADLVTSGSPGPLTPVLFLSEIHKRTLARRSLGRYLRVAPSIFRSGLHAEKTYGRATTDRIYAEADRQVLPGGHFERGKRWIRVSRPEERGAGMLLALEEDVCKWRESLAVQYPDRDIWPVVVIDPLQRWQEEGVSEVEALNLLAESFDQMIDRMGAIGFVASDTTKSMVSGKDEVDPTSPAVFRGSFKLIHACDVVLVLTAAEFDGSAPTRKFTAHLRKNRHGAPYGTAEFAWHGACGWFEASNSTKAQAPLPLDPPPPNFEADTDPFRSM